MLLLWCEGRTNCCLDVETKLQGKLKACDYDSAVCWWVTGGRNPQRHPQESKKTQNMLGLDNDKCSESDLSHCSSGLN
ncbi:hypothetical protein EXN66_Car004869 [Channa argus]|uniref:Uncharacterized protein n=1 Tax=Channa argus TaxID=215402 RepID=A0A6G1PG26_CHAAH|nr:hypothetical protein EXN66_Car004869 [Channa argus]